MHHGTRELSTGTTGSERMLLHRDDALRESDVGELRSVHDVADRPDPGLAGPLEFVHLDESSGHLPRRRCPSSRSCSVNGRRPTETTTISTST